MSLNVSVSSGNAATVSLNDRVKVVRNVNFVTAVVQNEFTSSHS